MNPKAVGELSEAEVIAHLVRTGRPVAIPFGNNQRYDLIVDEDGKLLRAQVKTGRLDERGVVTFTEARSTGLVTTRSSSGDRI